MSRLISLNILVMSRSSRTRDIGCISLLGLAMKRWYWACALWTMNSRPPLTAMPYCPSGA